MRIGLCIPREVLILIRDGNSGGGDGSASNVNYRSSDEAGNRLRKASARERHNGKRYRHDRF